MDDKTFSNLLYLAIAVIYGLVQRLGRRGSSDDAAEQERLDDVEQAAIWESWEEEELYAPAEEYAAAWGERWKASTSTADAVAPAVTAAPAAAPAAEERGKKIDHMLRRYGGWKKAVVMSELLHPPASATVR